MMTNEQAAIKLQNILNDDTYSWHPAHAEALEMAVEALKADLVNECGRLVKDSQGDLISRQALKAALADTSILEWGQLIKAFPMLEAVDEAPSAQPSFSQDHENDHIVEGGKMDCISRQAAIGRV